MVRLNIEDKAFSDPRLFKLARLLDNNIIYCMGLLAFLWYHSQNILLEEKEITSEIIKDAIHSDDDKVLDALISSGFIKENNDYTYTICGMKEQVDGILAYRTMKQSAGKRGGERSAEKRSKTKQNEAGA